mmetsp:Transcript_7623/g.30174  ORF Transcript_7623/g.30174 Transcript_7623/m.30174 type:complete len:396 (-) Transcript_7623:231-1418(-)
MVAAAVRPLGGGRAAAAGPGSGIFESRHCGRGLAPGGPEAPDRAGLPAHAGLSCMRCDGASRPPRGRRRHAGHHRPVPGPGRRAVLRGAPGAGRRGRAPQHDPLHRRCHFHRGACRGRSASTGRRPARAQGGRGQRGRLRPGASPPRPAGPRADHSHTRSGRRGERRVIRGRRSRGGLRGGGGVGGPRGGGVGRARASRGAGAAGGVPCRRAWRQRPRPALALHPSMRARGPRCHGLGRRRPGRGGRRSRRLGPPQPTGGRKGPLVAGGHAPCHGRQPGSHSRRRVAWRVRAGVCPAAAAVVRPLRLARGPQQRAGGRHCPIRGPLVSERRPVAPPVSRRRRALGAEPPSPEQQRRSINRLGPLRRFGSGAQGLVDGNDSSPPSADAPARAVASL